MISRSEYEELSRKASFYCDLKGELIKLRQTFLNDLNTVVLDPERFQETCRNVGAENIFTTIYEAMCIEKMSESRQKLNKIRAMVVIYMVMYGQSQKANYFQVALSRTL